MGSGVIKPQKHVLGAKLFIFTKVVLGHFGTTWSVLHRTSTKNYRRIEVSPMALWALRFFGNARPTQPHRHRAAAALAAAKELGGNALE
jgi:hypothetical protein